MNINRFIDKMIKFLIKMLVVLIIFNQPANITRLINTVQDTAPPFSAATEVGKTTAAHPTPRPPQKTQVAESTPTGVPQFIRPEPGSVCGFDPQVESMMPQMEQALWVNWIELLSGEKPVRMDGETYRILTRFTESMFDEKPNARAYDFVIGQLQRWGYGEGVNLIEQEYRPFTDRPSVIWKNIILQIPGGDPQLSHEQILMAAHLDSISAGDPKIHAPGADDNASGVATLLEAARLFKGKEFKRTIKIVFFTGEETGLHGSRAYINHYRHELEDIVGVFNLDMFGYDGDNDRCFEIHVGGLQDSNLIGGCLADTIETYEMNLNFEYLIHAALGSSDHFPFWEEGVGAVTVLENFHTHHFSGGCGEADVNPNYHTENDLVSAMNLETSHTIAKAAIAAVARLAEPMVP